jgi:hypothetical protein
MEQSPQLTLARAIAHGRLVNGTKKQYSRHINEIITWVKDNKPDLYAQDQGLIIPLPKEALLEFFGFISKKANDTFKQFSTVSSYRSALADYYFQYGGITMKNQLSDDLTDFIKGYKRKVSKR